jgi:excisionase family DNA binding protein
MTNPPAVPEVLTTAEVAAAWGVAKSTVCRWAEEGTLPGVIRKTPGRTGSYLFSPAALPPADTGS